MATFIVTAWAPKCRMGQTEPPTWVKAQDHVVIHRNTYEEARKLAWLAVELYKTDYKYIDMYEADPQYKYFADKN